MLFSMNQIILNFFLPFSTCVVVETLTSPHRSACCISDFMSRVHRGSTETATVTPEQGHNNKY